jgi:hypothetical protein
MAVGLPLKTTYANGDVYSASDVNDTNGTINTTAAPYAAGKNKIINGDYFVNQRSFTSVTTDGSFTFDRWKILLGGAGTLTATPQTFTPGAAPVAGYEARNFIQLVTASTSGTGDYKIFNQPIEDVRTFAGQTATLSFWAKAGSGTPKLALELVQNFGSGGSPSANVNTYGGQVTLSTSWVRYSVTVAIPSISGKTIGTTANTSSLLTQFWLSAGSDFNSRTGSLGLQNATFQIWGVQIEQGSTATPFQTATGTIQGELAACQRYYWRTNATNAYSPHGQGGFVSSTAVNIYLVHPVPMRISPTSLDFSSITVFTLADVQFTVSAATLSGAVSSGLISRVQVGITGGTAGTGAILVNNNTLSGYVGLSAEM